MHFFTPARLALFLLGLLGISTQARALTCFAADGDDLKAAVNKVVGNNWTDADTDTYGSIENWCTSKVTTMRLLFQEQTTFNADISQWDTSSVTDMSFMFKKANTFNQDIGAWDTSKVTDMGGVFHDARVFNSDISKWDTSSVTRMYWMFREAYAFNQDISGFHTSNVNDMTQMFHVAKDFNQDISQWDTSSVTRMWAMFRYTESFNQDLSEWNISSVNDIELMFSFASAFNQSLCAWKDTFPYEKAADVFTSSGCPNKATPTEAQPSFCAGTADDCQNYTPESAPIDSWDLELTSVTTDFDKGSGDEITLNYKIGKNRTPRVTLHKTGCKEDISGITIVPTEVLTNGDDPSTSNYEVSLDIQKSSIASSNIWDATDNTLKLCVMVALISSETAGLVVKKLDRNIEVALDFKNNFQTIEDANFTQITLGSNATEAAVNDYIKACTCNNKEEFICNTNVLGVDDFLNVCIRSLDDEMQINYLDSLQMTQDENTLNIVSNQGLVDGFISSKSKVATQNGVHVASVIPASFFSYESSSIATVSGVVFLKLSGSRRRLAVEMDDSPSTATNARALQVASDQESAFSMEVQLEKNELEVADDSNDAIYAVMTGVIGGAAAVVTTALLMW